MSHYNDLNEYDEQKGYTNRLIGESVSKNLNQNVQESETINACCNSFPKCACPKVRRQLKICTEIYFPCLKRWNPCALIAELLGTLILVLLIALSTLVTGSTLLGVAIAAGFALVGLITIFSPVSGAHFNPALTLLFWLTGHINLIAMLFYILIQLAGSLIAGLLVWIFFDIASGLGTPGAVPPFSQWQAFIAEVIGSTILFHVALFSVKYFPKNAPVAIGLTFTALEIVFIPISSGAFNVARWFGLAVISGIWEDWWVYIFPSFIGALITFLVYWILKCLCHQKCL